jgi:hypothetical protein
MLWFVDSNHTYKISERKLRLLSCAFARSYKWSKPTVATSSTVLTAAESIADATIITDLAKTLSGSSSLTNAEGWLLTDPVMGAIRWGRLFAETLQGEFAANLVRDIVGNPFIPWAADPGHMCPTSRDGIPDCSVCRENKTLLPRWINPLVSNLAKVAYQERLPDGRLDTEILSVLADALEEAGCDRGLLLSHFRGKDGCYCRGGRVGPSHSTEELCGGTGWVRIQVPHYRGCWALDVIREA